MKCMMNEGDDVYNDSIYDYGSYYCDYDNYKEK